jgi:hypothetical protein
MRVQIVKNCDQPGVPGKKLKKGQDAEFTNSIARDLVKKGFAKIIPRVESDFKVIEELGKQVYKKKATKKDSED